MRTAAPAKYTATVKVFLTLALSMCLASCSFHSDSLDKIKKSGKLTVITENSATSYYLYRDTPMGFEFDLAKEFADYLGVELRIVTPQWNGFFDALADGTGDLIAAGLTITPKRKKNVDFSNSYLPIQQHVITHRSNRAIKTIDDLNGREIHIRAGTSYHERLLQLRQSGIDFKLVLHENIPSEELLRRVEDHELELTVADSNIALLNRRYYPNIRMAFPITEQQHLAWATNKNDAALLEKTNEFFTHIKQNGFLDKLHKKYYANINSFDYFDLKKFHQRLETRLPKYEQFIKTEALKYGFDWRLISALIYQESHFDPLARSFTGVGGLMQLTRTTARELGISNRLDPRQSIQGGVLYLHRMYQRFDDIAQPERMLFTMAAYNIGYGHVRDAQDIARQRGLPPGSWQSLKETLPLLRYKKYYKKTKYGYARGTEPVRHVDRILTYYDILKQKTIEQI
ncbi:MAG: membrane-bound lytic murein transglycosylase MltF [Deltaproteobacteria bacterium]|nr:membrane-bound lytic murein transglycosylase MltF [Deltaproteobacteria bacterium]